jgi:hypothetical protein
VSDNPTNSGDTDKIGLQEELASKNDELLKIDEEIAILEAAMD